MTAWRFVDDVGGHRCAHEQMLADLGLLADVARGGAPVLRLYTWVAPALSLGRFQPDDDVDRHECARRRVEIVRRPTGGRALLHGADLTYAIVMPRPSGADGAVDAVYRWIARGLIAGLARLGIAACVARSERSSGPVCFGGQQGADLRVGNRKLCGSAQLHRDGIVLQHGAILLDRLPFDETDLLVGDLDRARLRRGTICLAELDAPSDPRIVAEAVVSGFAEIADLDVDRAATPVAGPSSDGR